VELEGERSTLPWTLTGHVFGIEVLGANDLLPASLLLAVRHP